MPTGAGSLVPRSPDGVVEDLVGLLLAPGTVRVLLDGVASEGLAVALVPALAQASRPAVRVRAEHFWRPAGERFEHGREDLESLRTHWLDAGALEREVLRACVEDPPTYLPALYDPARDRSARRSPEPVPPGAVVLVDGCFLQGRGLSADLTVHLPLSPAALSRRGVPDWQLAAHTAYDREARPAERCEVLVRAEDPLRPAILIRPAGL